MKRNSRLSGVLHALLHMADKDAAITSDELAVCLATNPVVVRRTMAGLREAGLVRSERGHGGGWHLARPLAQITLREVHAALGEPGLVPDTPQPESPCLIEAAVNDALGEAYAAARAVIVGRLAEITLADLAADFADRMAQHTHTGGRHGTDHAA